MFAAIKRSFYLAKESFRVLSHDPELLLLTAASFVGVVVVALLSVTGAITIGGISEDSIGLMGITLLLAGYFVGYFIIIYFQVALVSAVQFRMSGGDPNVGYAISQANRRLRPILSWTLIAASVGLILRILEASARGRNGATRVISLILVYLIGAAWSLLIFFVIPVIAAEGVGGFEAIRRSSRVMKKRWGEAIVGSAGMGLFMNLVTLLVAGPFILIGVLNVKSGDGITLAGIIFLGLGGLIAIVMAIASASLNSTYKAVVFAYAQTGNHSGFDQVTMDNAFQSR